MSKKLAKEDMDVLIEEWFAISKETNFNSIRASVNFITQTTPAFFQRLIDIGYTQGFEDGKQQKLDKIIKSN